MSQKASVVIISPDGSRGFITAKKARTFVLRGRARLRDDGALEFISEKPAPIPCAPITVQPMRAMHRATLIVAAFHGTDSGFGCARYPLPLEISSGPRFPGLARQGAGL